MEKLNRQTITVEIDVQPLREDVDLEEVINYGISMYCQVDLVDNDYIDKDYTVRIKEE